MIEIKLCIRNHIDGGSASKRFAPKEYFIKLVFNLLNVFGYSLNIFLNSFFRWLVSITLCESSIPESYQVTFEIGNDSSQKINLKLQPSPCSVHVNNKSFLNHLRRFIIDFDIIWRNIRIFNQLDSSQPQSIRC